MRATTMRTTMAAALALLAPSAALRAQDAPAAGPARVADAKWLAWAGCWTPAAAGAEGPSAVCVLPTGAGAVDVVTVADGRVTSREPLDANAGRVATTRDACDGWDDARWSADGTRLYVRSEQRCDGVTVGSTGVMAIAPTGEWIDVRGVRLAGGPPDVRVRRYIPLGNLDGLPAELVAEVRAAVPERAAMLRGAARANAATRLETADVAEAAKALDAPVVEALLVERGEQFRLDAKRLVALADAGVPERVIDMMVALSFPERFAIDGREPDPRAALASAGGVASVSTAPGYGYGGGYGYGAAYGARTCYDSAYPSAYCYGYSPYGWGRSAWGYGYYGAGVGPVIVVRAPDGAGGRDPHGRVVKGTGYTSGGASTGRSAEPRGGASEPRVSRGASSNGSSSGSSGGASSAGASSGGGSSTGRTAKPKDP